MHSALVSSRALALVSSMAFALAARGQQGAPPAPPAQPAPAGGEVAALLAVARIQGNVLSTARVPLAGGAVGLLVAAQLPGRDAPVAFSLRVFTGDAAGGWAVDGHDDVWTGRISGSPAVDLSVTALPVAPGALTATFGWKGADGGVEEHVVLYRHAAGRLSRLFAPKPTRIRGPGIGGEAARVELDVLPTVTAGYRDLRVRTRPCAPSGECGPPSEVQSYTFDGVKYVQRPYAIPFVERIEASSELVSAGAMEDHTAGAAIDGRPETAWCEGVPGPGWFQKLDFTFSPAKQLTAVSILPAGGTGGEFRDATRPKRVRILLPDKRKVEADLADEARPQRIAIPGGERVFGMTIVIVDVYKGKREDACFAELELEVAP